MLIGAGAAPRPPQPQVRPPNGTRCKPLLLASLISKPVNYSLVYSPLQHKVLVTGLPNLKAPIPNVLTFLPEVSIRELELADMNFVGLQLVYTARVIKPPSPDEHL